MLFMPSGQEMDRAYTKLRDPPTWDKHSMQSQYFLCSYKGHQQVSAFFADIRAWLCKTSCNTQIQQHKK